MFSDFSWAGNFAFGIAAAALDGFCLVPCTRDIWKFLTVLQWVLSTELKLLDSSNDSWISAFNGGKMYPSHFWWSERKLEGSSTRKKTPNQQSILLNSTISRPVSHLEALSHDFKVSICWSLQHLTDPPCRTPQHSAEGRAEQELWGGWHYMTEHGIWHSSAPSVSQRHPRFLPKSMLPLLTALCSSCLQECTTDLGTTAAKSWSVIFWGAFPSLHRGKNTRQSQTKLLFIVSAL